MPIRFFGPSGGSFRPFDSDVLLWRDSVVSNGGSVSLARLIVVDQFVYSEKASGCWALTDDYWGLWGENAPQALTSLKQRRLATAVNSPTFTADRGYQGDGATSYINTGFFPATNAVAMAQNDNRLGIYERTSANAGHSLGVIGASATNDRMFFVARTPTGGTDTMRAAVVTTTFNTTATIATGQGFSVASRNTSGQVRAWKTGALFDTMSPTLGTGLPVLALFICGTNNAGAFSNGRTAQMGFAVIGAALSVAQESAQYSAIQAWATSIGAQV